jgi:exosortase family protein XrtM
VLPAVAARQEKLNPPTITPLRFALRFALIFGLLFAAFEASRGSRFEEFIIHDLTLVPTAALINWAVPAEAVHLEDRTLVTTGSKLRVTRGCEGVEMFLLLAAGILAFPAALNRRARGFAVGAALAYVLTVARLMALHFTLHHSPAAWDLLHGLVLPLGPVLLIALYFFWWTGQTASAPAPRTARHAAA